MVSNRTLAQTCVFVFVLRTHEINSVLPVDRTPILLLMLMLLQLLPLLLVVLTDAVYIQERCLSYCLNDVDNDSETDDDEDKGDTTMTRDTQLQTRTHTITRTDLPEYCLSCHTRHRLIQMYAYYDYDY